MNRSPARDSFNDTVRLARDIVVLADDNGGIVECNLAALDAYGYPADQLKKMQIFDLRPEADRATACRQFATVSTNEGALFEVVHCRQDGSTFPVELSLRRIEIDGASYVLATIRDITVRHAMEREIARMRRVQKALQGGHSALLRAQVETELYHEMCRCVVEVGGYRMACVGLAAARDDKRVEFVAIEGVDNGYMAQTNVGYGDDPDSMGPTGMAIKTGEIRVNRDVETNPDMLRWRDAALSRGYRSSISLPLWDGRTVFGVLVIHASQPNAFDVEEVELLSAFAEDISYGVAVLRQRRRAKELSAELLESAKRYRELFEATPYPLIVVDEATRAVLDVNPAMTQFLGWSRDEFLTMNADQFFPPEELPRVIRERQIPAFPVTRTSLGLKCIRKDGALLDIDIMGRELMMEGRKVILSSVRDVTGRIRAEAARREAEEKLRQSQKLEAVGQLTGGIAHDFNNILMVVQANIETLEERDDLDSVVRQRLGRIGNATRNAADLTRQLLAYARKQALRPEITDVNELIGGIASLLGRTLGEHMSVELKPDGDLWKVDVDCTQLKTALINLCLNARDAMPQGGLLQIVTENIAPSRSSMAKKATVIGGDSVMIAVSDTGIGIPPDVLPKVFEPFFTTKRGGKGSGLGLSMVYGFITQSGGRLEIDSEVGRGTTIKMFLPTAPQAAAPKSELAGAQGDMPIGNGERILVVEDNQGVRTAIVEHVEALGYVATEAVDGDAGLVAMEAVSGNYDLLLTDVLMPGLMNGISLADDVGSRWPQVGIVLMTGYVDDVTIGDGLKAGSLLLHKPFHKRDLAQILRLALESVGRA